MKSLNIKEILELPVSSILFLEITATSDIYRRCSHSFYCKLLSATADKIELSMEIRQGFESFHFIDLALAREKDITIIQHPDFDITQQVFLDESDIDRVYTTRPVPAAMVKTNAERPNLLKLNIFCSL
jgi:hypothetical protein